MQSGLKKYWLGKVFLVFFLQTAYFRKFESFTFYGQYPNENPSHKSSTFVLSITLTMKQKKLDNAGLIKALQGNRAEQDLAISQLCSDPKVKGAILNFTKQYNLGSHTADDILQDALIILIKSVQMGQFQGNSKLTTFLIGIAKRLCQQGFRAGQKTVYSEPEKMRSKQKLESHEVAIIELESEKEYIALKRQLFSQLSEKCRRILLLAANDYSRKEIAEEMSWTNVQTAKNSVPECRKRLRKIIEENPKAIETIKRWL